MGIMLETHQKFYSCERREDRLNADNRLVVTNFQAELAQKIGSLCNFVATSMSKQQEQLHCVEKLCHSFTGTHDKFLMDNA
nr:kinesin-like protein kin-5c [Quercus suber]